MVRGWGYAGGGTWGNGVVWHVVLDFGGIGGSEWGGGLGRSRGMIG